MLARYLVFLVMVFWSGGVWALTFATSGGNKAVAYIAVTLTNSQSSSTSSNLTQLITINSNTNSAEYSSTINNVNWQDGAGNILDSWLESGETNTSTATNYWVNLGSNTIAGSGGTLTIYIVFYATSVNAIDGTDTGAEPNYTGTYGQYDNGGSVFSVYTNFSGTTIPSGWSNYNQVNSTYNNKLLLGDSTGGQSQETVQYNTQQTYPIIIDAKVLTDSVDGGTPSWWIGESTSSNSFSGGTPVNSYGWGGQGQVVTSGSGIIKTNSGAPGYVSGVTSSVTLPTIISFLWQSTGSQTAYNNYVSTWTSSDSSYAIGNYYILIANFGSAHRHETTIQWIRSRVVPPNATMPSTSAGSLTNLSTSHFDIIQNAILKNAIIN